MSGVPTPTIKHYMREGLLPGPEKRTSRNMAYYDAQLAARVRIIKELQQSRFLPLKLISEVLEPAPSAAIRADLDEIQRRQLGTLEPAVLAGTMEQRAKRSQGGPSELTATQVLSQLQLSAADLEILGALGLSRPSPSRYGEPVFTGSDLDILEIIDEIRTKDLGELFPTEILEPLAAAVRTLVRVELDLFRQRVSSGAKLSSISLDEVARQATQLGERLVIAMHAKLVIRELHALAAPNNVDDAPTAKAATMPADSARRVNAKKQHR